MIPPRHVYQREEYWTNKSKKLKKKLKMGLFTQMNQTMKRMYWEMGKLFHETPMECMQSEYFVGMRVSEVSVN